MSRGMGMVCFAIALAVAPLRAFGQTPGEDERNREAARVHYEKAKDHYNLAEYEQAIVEFKEAYRLWHEPLFLFNIGQAYRLKGDCPQAMRSYRAYLREVGSADQQVEVQAAMKLCEKAAPPEGEPEPAPRVTDPRPSGADVRPAPTKRKRLGWIVAASGGVVAAVGLGFGFAARSKWVDAKEMCDAELMCTPEGDALAGEARTLANVSTIVTAVGLAAVATGVVLVLTAPRAARARAVLMPAVDGRSVGVALTGSF